MVEVVHGYVYRAVRAYRGMEVNIHLFDLSEDSCLRFSRFTVKERAART